MIALFKVHKVTSWEKDVNVSVSGLRPNTKYDISVSSKPTEGGYWSENETISRTTHEGGLYY